MDQSLNTNERGETLKLREVKTEPVSEEEATEEKRIRLSGAGRRQLSRLQKSGVDYETAMEIVLEQKRARTEGEKPAVPTKRPHSDTEQQDKFRASDLKVGITHADHPADILESGQLGTVQKAVMDKVLEVPEGGPQIRFVDCTRRPGWLLITCADEESATWLSNIVPQLEPWQGAKLKSARGKDLPNPRVCTAYIPDDEPGVRLTADVVLTRLRKMNRGLLTREWVVLFREASGPGQLWTFSVDKESMKALLKLNFKPFFGFGQVQFRKKRDESYGSKPKKDGSKFSAQQKMGYREGQQGSSRMGQGSSTRRERGMGNRQPPR